jgi:hypothetical protein
VVVQHGYHHGGMVRMLACRGVYTLM